MFKLKFKTSSRTINILKDCKISVIHRDSYGNTWDTS